MSSQTGNGDQSGRRGGNYRGHQAGDLSGRTPDEIEALQALLMLGGEPQEETDLTAPAPLPPAHAPDDSAPPAASLQPSAPPLSGSAPQEPLIAADVQAEMTGNLQEFVTHALMTTNFRTIHYIRVAVVANRFGGRPRLQDALVALDYADWDLGGAIQQLQHDAELRQAAAAAGPEPAGPDPNRGLDRARASGGPNWDRNKLKLQIKVGGKWKSRNYEDVDGTLDFNADGPSPRDLLRLNRWRHRQIFDLAGPPRRLQGPSAGDSWHPTTVRDLRQRIKSNLKRILQDSKAQPDYTGIAKAHNNLFKGLKLPGQVQEVPERNYDQTAATINREWKKDKYKKAGKRVQAEKGLEAIRKEERKERKRCEKTEQRDFSSTVEDLDEVENETLVLESDWEEETTDDEDD